MIVLSANYEEAFDVGVALHLRVRTSGTSVRTGTRGRMVAFDVGFYRVEYLWLCERWARTMTITLDGAEHAVRPSSTHVRIEPVETSR